MFFCAYPVSATKSLLTSIPKKGNLLLPENWRDINMLSGLAALYDRILGNRIKHWMHIPEEQSAYQIGKSCLTQTFTLRCMIEICKKQNANLYVAVLDLEKVFDRVDRVKMLETLHDHGMGRTMLEALKNMYSKTVSVIENIGTIICTIGIRQGAVSSCYIFIIFINSIISMLKTKFSTNNIYGEIHSLKF